MKCLRPNCPNKAKKGKNQGYCLKHYELLPSRGLADAAPVRARLRELNGMGFGYQELADAFGMTRQGLEWILDGKSTRVQARTWDRVMTFAPASMPTGGLVSTVGSRRRVQALAVLGWPQCEVASRADVNPKTLSRVLTQQTMLARNAAAIAKVFDELQMTPGPSRWVRQRAARKGWVPPLAWDDPDNPDEVPALGDQVWVPFPERLAELEYLHIPRSEMPRWLGIQDESFERQLSRHQLKEAV